MIQHVKYVILRAQDSKLFVVWLAIYFMSEITELLYVRTNVFDNSRIYTDSIHPHWE